MSTGLDAVSSPSSLPSADRVACHQPRSGGSKLGGLKLEAIVFVLLVATFAAVLFKNTIVDRHMAIRPSLVAQLPVYSYSDQTSGGASIATSIASQPLKWSCEIKPGYAYPFCGYGLILDKRNTGSGRDLSRFSKVTLVIDYRGASETLKLALKNRRMRDGKPVADEDAQPNAIEFKVVPGRQTIELQLADAVVEPWWIEAHQQANPLASTPMIDNVVAIDLQTGPDARPGHHEFEVESLDFDGSVLSTEQWYLLILGIWTTLAALLLVYRVLSLKRHMAARQEQHIAEARMMETARAAAESASHAKSRFLANMSHELRTPLNAILGYAQILRSADLGERHQGAAGTIQESGEHLLSLITDILDLSKIEAGKVEITAVPFDVRAMVRSVAEMTRLRAEEKRLHFGWSIAPDVPAGIEGDEKHLRQVLINLLGNAVKFTHSGQVMFLLGVVEQASGDVRLRFEVRDTGQGIAADALDRVFEAFEQAGTAGTRANGTGLGLSISQQLITRMGSRIEAESREGEGSRFWFDLALPLADRGLLTTCASEGHSNGLPAQEPARGAFSTPAVPPPALLEPLLAPARAGSMRAVCVEAKRLIVRSPEYADFGAHILELARGYQSAAVLDVIERHLNESVEA
ncbi:sensor histidine kinase [Sphingomonas sp. Root241]|uniref:sensor histidine kinase n=1 Tax=Sphingomonas sp. Root241 TaxID=1736501 RepID=UPI0009EAC1B6|nr:ATP-binding protein [Sphingomonas sp. Root241]